MKVSRTRIPSNKTTYEEGRQEIEAVEKSARFHYRVMFFHSSITRRTFFYRTFHYFLSSMIQDSSWQRPIKGIHLP